MYRGFNVELDLKKDDVYQNLLNIGRELYNQNISVVRSALNNFVQKDSSLDGSAIQREWFPEVKADIFLSHSHKNLDLVLVLAGWIKDSFGLEVFIDSCVWGYGNDLLRSIDNKYCYMPDKHMYSYQLRNHSTSHVHMMLSTALMMMMDKAECIFFLNTPDSIKSYGDTEKTESPWIYTEISATQILRKKVPDRLIELNESFSHADGMGDIEKAVKVTYDIDLSHLADLTFNDLIKWQNKRGQKMHPLDILYMLKPNS